MQRCRAAHLWVLLIGLALSSPKMMAQLAPASELPSADRVAVRTSSRPVYSSPIVAYTPPTEKEKLRFFEFDAFGPYAFAKATLAGGFQQSTKSPPEWGTGWDAFGTRVASNFGIQLVTTTTRYGMAEILREDTAYYRCECKGFFPRFGHAVISTVTARHGEDGHTAFSFSGLVRPMPGTMTALAWYPDRYRCEGRISDGQLQPCGPSGRKSGSGIYLRRTTHAVQPHSRSKSPDRTVAESKSVGENRSTAPMFRPLNRTREPTGHLHSGLDEIRSPFQAYSDRGIKFVIYGINFYLNRDNDQSLARVVWGSRELFLEGDLRGRHKTV